ncbi:hypothetical protein D0469_13965 [Peribacillus saganii]|uniref:IseA DL-endopeptidase inhibitor family protein n=1 Tax=Peribacillus saganii TaxID=2303992 RepID=A0A372LLA9_9BACI|nr:DL-endopeptidase inhibitor IseA family protein [Peribacillus saganii]RFU67649.1 hypothetical protein D0469_13965 [Peribacillus saganii]
MKKLISILFAAIVLFAFNIGASAHTANGSLTSANAAKLSSSARDHFQSFVLGYNVKAKDSKCKVSQFTLKGVKYQYYCSEFNTKAKLTKYMNEVFTLNAIKKGMKKYKIIEYKGKLAFAINDSATSFIDWNKAKGKLLYQRKDVKLYEFTIPEVTENKLEKRKVTFVNVKGKWLINQVDAAI